MASQQSKSSQAGKFNYAEALQKSYLFYEAQRAGDLDEKTKRIPWRGDSTLTDGSDVGRDLSGGYFDAGDHVKFGFPMAATMTMLAWGVNEFTSGYEKVGQLDEALDAIKWGTDYILKAYDDKGTAAVSDDVFYAQVGDGGPDHGFWGPPELLNMERPTFQIDAQNPGSDLAGESAAALASASIIFRSSDSAYADKLLAQAQKLYDFAETYTGKYTDSINEAYSYYGSRATYLDELCWGAAWLHKATKAAGQTDPQYLNKAEQYRQAVEDANFIPTNNEDLNHNWYEKRYGTDILLAQETGDPKYQARAEKWLDSWMVDKSQGGMVEYTEGGLAWLYKWGALRQTANASMLAGIYANTVNDKGGQYSKFVEQQINYMLGDNPNNRSYVIGFGENSPQNPHHRGAHGSTTNNIGNPTETKNILYGALVGGPSAPDDNAWKDDRSDYIANEVTLDYNAGYTGALAFLVDKYGGTPLPDSEIPKLFDPTSAPPTPVDPNPVDPNPVDPTPVEPTPVANGIDFSVTNSWQDGFQGEIAITNQSDSQITGWTLKFEYPNEITQIWNAEIVSHTGNTYVIRNADYDGVIAPNGKVSFGFASTGAPSLKPSGFELNGQSLGAPVPPNPVPPNPVPPNPVDPNPMNAIRMEAEALTLEGYKISSDPKSGASGGQFISLNKEGSGTASGSFTGPEGRYQVKVGYYDENDGVSSATVKIAGDSQRFLFDQDLPGNSPRPKNQASLITHDAIALKSGQTFEISAQANLKERARFDYIEFIPVDSSIPTSTPTPTPFIDADQDAGAGGDFTGMRADAVVADSTSADPTPADSTPGNAGVKFDLLTDWGSGFQGKIFITNQGTEPLSEWTLEFEFDSTISEIWNAEIASHIDNRYVIRNTSGKGSFKPGETIHFAFNAEGSAPSSLPSVFEFNGQVVGGPSTPTPVDPTPVDPTPVDPAPVDPTPGDVIRMEAEALTLDGYQIKSSPKFGASGGQLISLNKDGSGKASGSFTGPEGMYQVKVGYYDENDGVSSATVKIAGESKRFLFDQDLPGNSASPKNQTSLITHDAIALKSGQTFEISAQANLKEHARFDYIEFIPVDSSTPSLIPAPTSSLSTAPNPISAPVSNALLELNKTYIGQGTYYAATGAGNAGYDEVPLDQRDMITALNHVQWNNSEASGAFFQVSGPYQRDGKADPITVMVVDQLPDRGDGLDLSAEAFAKVGNPVDGIINLEYELVSPADDFTTPYGHQIGDGIIVDRLAESNPWWAAVRLTNHRHPVQGLDLITDGGEIAPLERKSNNIFVLEQSIGGPLTGKHDFVATDIFGQQVALNDINITSGASSDIVSGKQFAMIA